LNLNASGIKGSLSPGCGLRNNGFRDVFSCVRILGKCSKDDWRGRKREMNSVGGRSRSCLISDGGEKEKEKGVARRKKEKEKGGGDRNVILPREG